VLAAFISTEYGLNNSTSIGASLFSNQNPETDKVENELISTITHQLGNSLISANLGLTSDQKSFDGLLIGRLGKRTNYQVSMEVIENNDDKVELPSKMLFSSNLSGIFNNNISYGFSALYNSQETATAIIKNETKQTQLTNQISWRYKKVQLSNSLIYQNNKNETTGSFDNYSTDNDSITNNLSMSVRYSDTLNFRFTGKFNLSDTDKVNSNSNSKFQNFSSTVNWRVADKMNFSSTFNINHNDDYNISNNFSWQQDRFNLNLTSRYSGATDLAEETWQLGIGISFNLDYDYYNKSINIQNTYAASSATLDLFTYIDNNQNAIYDEYDEALSNVGFGSAEQWEEILTNEDGVAYLPGASGNLSVYFDTSQTKYPQLQPVTNNFKFNTHPGGLTSLDIPFNYSIELEGIVNLDPSIINKSAKFVPLQLIRNNKIVKEIVSDQDNYFSITQVWPGNYKLQVAPEFLKQKGLTSIPLQTELKITGAHEFLTLEDIILIEDQTESNMEISNVEIEPKEIKQNSDDAVITSTLLKETPTAEDSPINKIISKPNLDENDYTAVDLKLIKPSTLVPEKLAKAVTKNEFSFSRKEKVPSIKLKIEGHSSKQKALNSIFSIQTGAYTVQKNCDVKQTELKNKGIKDTFIYNVGSVCKVLIGKFENRQAASFGLKALPRSIQMGVFFVKIDV